MTDLTPYEIDVLRSASGGTKATVIVFGDQFERAIDSLVLLGLLAPDSGAVGAGYAITDAGRDRIAKDAAS